MTATPRAPIRRAVGLLRRRHQERLRPGQRDPSGARFGTRSMIARTRWPSSSRAGIEQQLGANTDLMIRFPQGAGALSPILPDAPD